MIERNSNHPSAKLPIELWRLIFLFATDIPRGYDSSLSSPFNDSEIRTGYVAFQHELNTTHRTKRSLRLVSRKFAAIIQELIFDYLFLQDVDGTGVAFNWCAFAPYLEEGSRKAETLGRRGAGWFSKRLEIYTTVDPPTKGEALDRSVEDNKIDAAARILRCCPNIKVLKLGFLAPHAMDPDVAADMNEAAFQHEAENIDVVEDVQLEHPNDVSGFALRDLIPYPVFSALFPSSKASCYQLRRLEWTSDIIPATNLLFTYLPTLPNLEYLSINVVHTYYSDSSAIDIVLTNLHTLEIVSSENDPSSLLCLIATWKLEKLQRFALKSLSDLSNPLPFYRSHGKKINIHDLIFLGTHTGVKILRLCISLNDMIIHMHWAAAHVTRLGSKTVKRIGIRCADFPDVERLSEDAKSLFDCFKALLYPLAELNGSVERPPIFYTHPIPLRDLDDQPILLRQTVCTWPLPMGAGPFLFPSLHTIRLLDFSPDLFRQRKWPSSDVVKWAFWVQRFERLRIRLEDSDGIPIRIIFSEVKVFLPGDNPTY